MQYDQAEKELLTSLQTVDTGKAKTFLNELHTISSCMQQQDEIKPNIDIAALPSITNQREIELKGRISDNRYVASLVIDDSVQFIELAEQVKPFHQIWRLKDGLNHTEIVAVDLCGNTSRRSLQVYLDRFGPVVSLETATISDGRLRVRGQIADAQGLVQFRIAGRPVTLNAEQPTRFDFDEVFDLKAQDPGLPFEALDTAGNITAGTFAPSLAAKGQTPPTIKDSRRIPQPWSRWAMRHSDATFIDMPSYRHSPLRLADASVSDDADAPKIYLVAFDGEPILCRPSDSKDNVISTYENQISFSLQVSSRQSVINDIQINRVPIALPINEYEAKRVFYTEVLALKRGGRNRIVIEAFSKNHKKSTCPITVVHKLHRSRQSEQRLKVALQPYANERELAHFYHEFHSSIRDKNRFQFDFFDPPEASMTIDITKDKRWVNETFKIIGIKMKAMVHYAGSLTGNCDKKRNECLTVDTYSYVDLGQFQNRLKLPDALSIKVISKFPLIEGDILDHKSNTLITNLSLSRNNNLLKNMKLVVYDAQDDGEILQDAKLIDINRKESKARLLRAVNNQSVDIDTLNKVITK